MGIEIQCNNKSLKIINVYLPGGASDQVINQSYKNDLLNITNLNDPFIIVGDLNSKHTDWNCDVSNVAGNILKSTSDNSNFFIDWPPHHTYCPMSVYKSHATIDLILTNYKIPINSISTRSQFSSDHLPVECNIAFEIDRTSIYQYNFNKANWQTYRSKIDIGLDQLIYMDPIINSTDEIDKKIKDLTTLIQEAKTVAIPQERSGHDKIFIDPLLKNIINQRNYFRRRFLHNHDPIDNDYYKELQSLVKSKLKEARQQRWENKIKDCTPQNNNIHMLAKSIKRNKTDIPNLIDESNNTASSDIEKASSLANYFSNNHTNTLNNSLIIHTNRVNATVKTFLSNPCPPPDSTIDYRETAEIIKNLKNGKSPGDDGICNRLLKNLPNRAINFLTAILNYCLIMSHFPSSWKNAIVFPLNKPGKDKTHVSGYRPISLLNSMSKVLERIILRRLQNHIDLINCLPNIQFGFRPGHSTGLQLLRLHNFITEAFKNKLSVGMITFDVWKAFDTVWHNGLIYKLINLKFPGHLIKIINSFLTNRSFQVKVGNAVSPIHTFNYGVPQGAVLSPCLYSLYTHDIPNIDCNMGLFADDTGMFTAGRLYKGVRKKLTKGAKTISGYFRKWKISLNKSKTCAIFFTKRKKKQLPQASDFIKIEGERIPWSTTIKYLGCTLDRRLTYKTHINNNLNKCCIGIKSLYPLIHRKSNLSTRIKNNMYKTYFRPVLTYPPLICLKSAKTHRNRLQIQQNKLLRLLNNRPYYTRNSDLHNDSKIKPIDQFLENLNDKAKARAEGCSNPLVAELFLPM